MAAMAGSVHLDDDQALCIDLDQANVSPIGAEAWPKSLQDGLDFGYAYKVTTRRFCFGSAWREDLPEPVHGTLWIGHELGERKSK